MMLVPISYNLRSLFVRKARTLLTVGGIAAVVSVYVVMTAVSGQMKQMFRSTGQPDEILVMQAGAANPEFSQVSRTAATWLATQAQVASAGAGGAGRPVISPELSLQTKLRFAGGADADVMLRGINPEAVAFYREVTVMEGQPLASGTTVLVGVQLARAHHLKVGDTLPFERTTWTIGGILAAQGAFYEQEIWVDLDALAAAANRTQVTTFMVRCKSEADTTILVDTINNQRSEPLLAMTAANAFKRVGGMSIWMAALGQFIAVVIAFGAVFGGMNTMYAAVASRGREIGMLRAIGYRSGAVLLSMWVESLMVGIMGGVAGLLLAFVVARVPLNMPFLLEGSVSLQLRDLVSGLTLALIVGGLGGLLPSLQAARVKVVDALR